MFKYEIVLTEAENKALSFVCKSPQEWIENAAKERARIAMEEIFMEETKRMLKDNSIQNIPANIEQVVLDSKIQSIAEAEQNNVNP